MLIPFGIKKILILTWITLVGFPALAQDLRLIHPKGYVSSTLYIGDRLQLTVQDSAGSSERYRGQLTGLTADSLRLTTSSQLTQTIAVQRLTGVRKTPSFLVNAAAGVAIGATMITIIDKRNPASASRTGLSLLAGAGAGIAVTLGQRAIQPKRLRQRKDRGWSFQLR